jgi:tetratricopeptide (TPR) repeat protein
VQWTRLPGGDTPSAFCDRVKTLIMVGPKPEARPQRPASGSAGGNSAPPRLWIAPVLVGLAVIVALGFWQPWRRGATTPLPTPVSVVSEADQLIARAQAQIGKTDSTVDDAAVAEDLCRHAVELAPDSPRAWAERAYVQSYYIQRTWDSSEKRLQDTQTFANRALALDPNESEAMLALSTVLLRQGSFPQAETMLRQALALQPGDARIWRRITIVRCCSLNIMPVPATPRTQWSISENASTSARITPIGPWRTTPGGISCADSPSLTPC